MEALDIWGTCKAIQAEKIEVDIGRNEAKILDPFAPYFLENCQKFLTQIVNAQVKNLEGRPPRIWTPAAVRTTAGYLRKHNIPFQFAADPNPDGNAVVSLRFKRVQLGLEAYALFNEEELLTKLDHEMGHLRDDHLLAEHFPKLKGILLAKKRRGVREESIAVCEAHIALFERKMSAAEKKKFQELTKAFFGDFAVLSDQNLNVAEGILAETLRAGEEVDDPRWKRFLLGPNFIDFSLNLTLQRKFSGFEMVDEKGRRILDHRSLWVAFMKAAGIWETFKQRKDVSPKLVRHFEADRKSEINFFESAIQAARFYFKKKPAAQHRKQGPSKF